MKKNPRKPISFVLALAMLLALPVLPGVSGSRVVANDSSDSVPAELLEEIPGRSYSGGVEEELSDALNEFTTSGGVEEIPDQSSPGGVEEILSEEVSASDGVITITSGSFGGRDDEIEGEIRIERNKSGSDPIQVTIIRGPKDTAHNGNVQETTITGEKVVLEGDISPNLHPATDWDSGTDKHVTVIGSPGDSFDITLSGANISN
ncbi:MAG: hypothetical protein LBT34_03180, partial [Clostridiales Family XIII bacterium]|nr:hypothetical protein [Clostridiales Family XIII bacterium]